MTPVTTIIIITLCTVGDRNGSDMRSLAAKIMLIKPWSEFSAITHIFWGTWFLLVV